MDDSHFDYVLFPNLPQNILTIQSIHVPLKMAYRPLKYGLHQWYMSLKLCNITKDRMPLSSSPVKRTDRKNADYLKY